MPPFGNRGHQDECERGGDENDGRSGEGELQSEHGL